MRTSRRLAGAAVGIAAVIGLAACSGSSGTSIGNGSTGTTPKGAKQQGGTATLAWSGGVAPNFIFPYPPATNTNGYNQNLTQYLWPFVAVQGEGAQSAVNPAESLYSSVNFSNDDKTATIKLKPWKWSDGAPITSRDFTFVYNLLKVNKGNWAYYVPGVFPDGVASVQAQDVSTVVVNLTQSTNPDFFIDNVMSQIQLVPQHAWDKTSATGKVGNYDETAAGAKQVYAFLQKEGGDMSTFTTNPLWKVVDGAWTLTSFNPNGDYAYVPNKNYSGPNKPTLSKFATVSFTDTTSLVDALRSGSGVDVAESLPLNDVGQLPQLKAEGYSAAQVPLPGEAGIYPNFYNAQVGSLLNQLYIRQVLEDLINRPQIVSKVFHGYADPGNGPIPLQGFSEWVSPQEKAGGAYPYNPSKATSLLKSHGWKVTPNGVTTCQSPGTGATQCGSGVKQGQPLTFQLAYSSGSTTTDETEAAIQSSEAQAGIKINLRAEPFDTLTSTIGVCTASSHPASSCGWQLVDFGYNPYYLYPASQGIFDSAGNYNQGGFSDPKEDQLIHETEYGGGSAQTFYQYEDYTAEQLPQLWVPLRSKIVVYRSNLAGVTPLNPFSGGENAQDWYYVKS
ncbi:MAG TPA: ABC transporter substrate-binding protein [Streptosporangiaceae bacterium]